MTTNKASINSILDAAAIAEARKQAASSGRSHLQVLEENSQLNPDEFVTQLAIKLHYKPILMSEMHQAQPAFDLIPFAQASMRHCVALLQPDHQLVLAFADPFNTDLQVWAEANIREIFEWRLAHRADVAAYLSRQEESMRAMDHILVEGERETRAAIGLEDLSLLGISEDSSPVVKLVRSTLYDALKVGASDIHIETEASGLSIKYRIDGVINSVGGMGGLDVADQVISRLKVMSELDISERRVPQDGRFKVSVQGREVDFRVSIMPSMFGEDAVLRILDRRSLSDQARTLRLDYLGFEAGILERFRRLTSEPYGMVLVTGPTGSGKTTTLYAAITEINHGYDKIITIEDPVEYQLPGVLQIPVNEKKGLTFARGLRSILRHDPDKVMVGEIRDGETAQIAVQAALTGHLVFSTVHANNVFDVIGRFVNMGVDPYSFVSAINGIMAQRLVRINCPHCADSVAPTDELLVASGLDRERVRNYHFKAGKGCGQCRGTGYKGRKAVAEILYLTDEIRELIVGREPIRKIKEIARAGGTRYMREAALELVSKGETTLEEVNRVTLVA